MSQKPGKSPNDVRSYRPISLIAVVSILFGKLLLERLYFDYSSVDQVHRVTDIIVKALEEKKICSTLFLDAA